MQSDGNLVVYDAANQARWHSSTYGRPGAYARVRDGGRVVVCSAAGARLWSTDGGGKCGTPPAP